MNDDLGTITRCYNIAFKRQSKHNAARLWKAITEPGEITAWSGFPARVDLRLGGEWVMVFPEGRGACDGVIVAVDEGRELAYAWGLSVVQWKLEPAADGGCEYTFLQNGLPDRGEGEEGAAAGWDDFLEGFENHLEGRPVDLGVESPRWHSLLPVYKAALDKVLRS